MDILYTVELNGAHIDVYQNSIVFHDDIKDESWEYEWKDLYRLTDFDCLKNVITKAR